MQHGGPHRSKSEGPHRCKTEGRPTWGEQRHRQHHEAPANNSLGQRAAAVRFSCSSLIHPTFSQTREAHQTAERNSIRFNIIWTGLDRVPPAWFSDPRHHVTWRLIMRLCNCDAVGFVLGLALFNLGWTSLAACLQKEQEDSFYCLIGWTQHLEVGP